MNRQTILALAVVLALPAAAQADSREQRGDRGERAQRTERVERSESSDGSTLKTDGKTWTQQRGARQKRGGWNVVRTQRGDVTVRPDRNDSGDQGGLRNGSRDRGDWNNDRSGTRNRGDWSNDRSGSRSRGDWGNRSGSRNGGAYDRTVTRDRGWNTIPQNRYRDYNYNRTRNYNRSRTQVIVRRGWPIRRTQRYVYVRPYRPYRVFPSFYLGVHLWHNTWARPVAPPQAVTWRDRATLYGTDDWTEFSLNSGVRGDRIGFVVDGGDVQIDWAEVVYSNGETEVVDFDNQVVEPGEYELLDFGETRTVDHVRIVARAQDDEASMSMIMD